jgi:hypothetical protein
MGGREVDSALKVEQIEALSELPFLKPPADYVSVNSSVRCSQQAGHSISASPSKPSLFNALADRLLAQHESKKGLAKDSKEPKE